MARRKERIIYSEVDTFFRLDNSKDIVLSVNGDAVADSIRNIIKTRPGERVYQIDFGTKLMHLLFEPLDEETAYLIGDEIVRAIEEEDNRVIIKQIQVTPNYDRQSYDIVIDYSIRQLPTSQNRITLELAGAF